MDLRALLCFRTVAELGTISKASSRLRIAQPALTRQIQKLEHSLGVELLHRTHKGVRATAAGQLLLERTSRLEAELAELRRDVTNLSSQLAGSLHLAVQAPLSTLLIPGLVSRFITEHPGVLRDEPGDQARDQQRRERRLHRQMQAARELAREVGDVAAQLGELCLQTRRPLQQELPGGGGADSFVGAVQKLDAQAVLQLLDLPRQGRLRDAQARRRLGDGAEFGDRAEAEKRAEVHVPGQCLVGVGGRSRRCFSPHIRAL